ncbi:MAG: hypothetical protein UMR38_01050 [Candidatus Izemoplasma sp.]|nr:hypothetical protein [Candidatus Izemoplasma sp.]
MLNGLLERCEKRCRKIDIELIKSFEQNNDDAIIKALKAYQNDDGGFGHGLEPDVQLPDSNVVATNTAVSILLSMKQSNKRDALLKECISYYESIFDEDNQTFPFVPKEVDDHPHAVWWNYDNLGDFPFGNPNLEIIGFLYQFKDALQSLDIDGLMDKAMRYIKEGNLKGASMHTVLSAVRFYDRIDDMPKVKIYAIMNDVINSSVEWEETQWDEYCLEPYKIRAITPDFMKNYISDVVKNINYRTNKLEKTLPEPSWSWHQYDDAFEEIKDNWIGLIIYDILKAKEQLS